MFDKQLLCSCLQSVWHRNSRRTDHLRVPRCPGLDQHDAETFLGMAYAMRGRMKRGQKAGSK